MPTTTPTETSNRIADAAAQSADQAIKSTQRVANGALDGLSNTVKDLHDQATPLLNRAAEQASALAHRSLESAREGTQKIRSQVQHASESTAGYIKEEPFKAVLIAAATGAALMALISLVSRSRHHD
jgi:ElaB/YqjD/DUF883 family membrane-anchored ribosome-binding protein